MEADSQVYEKKKKSLFESSASIENSEEGELSICEQIFTELVEAWLDAHAFELFAKTQENLLSKSNKRQKK